MKKIFLAIGLIITNINYAQTVPQAFNYQGIARDAQGVSLPSQQLGIKITLQEINGQTTTNVYAETFTVTTNAVGLFNIAIGKGTPILGTFSGVAFANKNISVKTEIDPTGGNNYTISGNSDLLSVPYALVAGNATSGGTNYWSKNSLGSLYVNNSEDVAIGNTSPTHRFEVTSSETGTRRELVRVQNTSTGSDAVAYLTIFAGPSTTNGWLSVGHHSPNYTASNGYSNISVVSAEGNGLMLKANNPNGFLNFMTGGGVFGTHERMRITSTGNIGIGNASPSALLDVAGTVKFGSLASSTTNTKLLSADANGNLAFRDLSTISSLSSPWIKDIANNSVYVNNNERIGIGTINNTNNPLLIQTNGTGSDRGGIVLKTINDVNDSQTNLYLQIGSNLIGSLMATGNNYFPNLNATGYNILTGYSSGVIVRSWNTTGGPNGNIRFQVGNDVGAFPDDKMIINGLGNVGIGTSNPTAKLQVTAGDVYLDDATKGVIMKSPNGTCWRVTVGDTGTLTSTAITCP